MKPTIRVAETDAPDGARFVLLKHDGEFLLYMDDRQIMTTTMTHSELLLSNIGCDFKPPRPKPRVLIGGLGLGFSLRRALEITGKGSQVVVAELLPEIVRWNHEYLDGLNDDILADSRTEIVQKDVFKLISHAAKKGAKFDAILLDVDDGPTSLIQPQNSQLYGEHGLEVIKKALTPGGRLAIWAAIGEPKLLNALGRAGFRTEEIACAKHERAKRQNHRIYLAEMKS